MSDWLYRLRAWTPLTDLRAFWQRGRRGYAAGDAWSLDSYLAPIIAGACEQIAERGVSCPPDLTPVEWSIILRKIADGFRVYERTEDGSDPAFLMASGLLATWYPHLWD